MICNSNELHENPDADDLIKHDIEEDDFKYKTYNMKGENHMLEQYYLDTRYVPEIFKIADREMEKRYPREKIITEPKQIPMPYIKGCESAHPVVITEDWYWKKKKKQLVKRAKEKKEIEIEMMQLLAKRDMLRIKLGELDPANKHDSKKIVAINIELKDIKAELLMLEQQSGIRLDDLDHGSRLARFIGRMKRRAKKVCKKIKNFFNENSDFIANMAAIVVPVVTMFLSKLIFGNNKLRR